MKNCLFISFLFFLTLTVICSTVSAQNYLLDKREKVEKRFKQYSAVNKVIAFMYSTDSTLRLSVQDSTKRGMDITCFFNSNGRCYKETKATDCDECFQKYLGEVLSKKMYKWKKVNETLYISTAFWNKCIVIDRKNPFSYSIIHELMNKREQKALYQRISS